MLDAPPRVQHDREIVRAQKLQRGDSAGGRVRESQRLAVEHPIQVEEEQTPGPSRPLRPRGEAAVESIHAVDQKVTSPQVALVPRLTAFAGSLTSNLVCCAFHGQDAVEQLIEEKAINDRSVATLPHVRLQQLLFLLFCEREFKDSRSEVISRIDNVQLRSAKIMLFEIHLVDSSVGLDPFVRLHPTVNHDRHGAHISLQLLAKGPDFEAANIGAVGAAKDIDDLVPPCPARAGAVKTGILCQT